jgi:thiamine transport system substrate-binding protein
MNARRTLGALLATTLLVAGCGDDSGEGDDQVTLRLLTHDSFNATEAVLDRFTEETGIGLDLVPVGDAGSMVNQAVLTRDAPLGDVLFGVDNTLLATALEADLFVPYESPLLDAVDERFHLDPEHRVTPIDRGDVCLNYDKAAFAGDLAPPDDLDDLVDPAYAGMTVVQNPATSSPGLAFLLATVDRYGEDGWQGWWAALVDNDVLVTAGWEDAYYGSFSGGAGEGDRPIVVSYASSPPAEVVFAEPPPEESPIGVVEESCFGQVEGAGILAGTEHEEEAGQLLDFLLSVPFQEDIPLQMFVFPVNGDAELPEAFVRHAVVPEDPHTLPVEEIGANRERWVEEWTSTVLR